MIIKVVALCRYHYETPKKKGLEEHKNKMRLKNFNLIETILIGLNLKLTIKNKNNVGGNEISLISKNNLTSLGPSFILPHNDIKLFHNPRNQNEEKFYPFYFKVLSIKLFHFFTYKFSFIIT
jgi:hypothetical protein